MKRLLKAAASLFLAAALMTTELPINLSIDADAAGKLSTKTTYADDGTAIVTVTASEWENEIRYTTDGSAPTAKSKLYVAPIEVDEKTTIRIAEFNEDDDKIKGIKKTVSPKIARVTFKIRQDHVAKKAYLTMDCGTDGAKIYYTTDGTKPDQDSECYTGEIEVTEKTKFRVRAYCSGYKTTTTHSVIVKYEKPYEEGVYADIIRNPGSEDNDDSYAEVIKNPVRDDDEKSEETKKEETKVEVKEEEKTEVNDEKTEDKDEEKKTVVEKDDEEKSVSEKISYKITYMDTVSKSYVTLLKSKASNVIRYTTDGSAVTKNSKVYSKRVGFEEPGVFRAKEYTKAGKLVATLKINVKIKCAQVEFGCIAMDSGIRTITMSTKTPDATIYYTTDGSSPTAETGYVYTAPLTIGELVDIKAIAVKDDYRRSNIAWEIAGRIELTLQDFDFSDHKYRDAADELNKYRRSKGYGELILDEKLTRAACVRAHEMSVYMDHARPNGTRYTSAILNQGVDFSYSSELFSYNKETAQEFIKSLVSDKANADHILETGYDAKKIGIGYYKKGHAEYWVLLITD